MTDSSTDLDQAFKTTGVDLTPFQREVLKALRERLASSPQIMLLYPRRQCLLICDQCGQRLSALPPPEFIDEMKPRLLCPVCMSGVQMITEIQLDEFRGEDPVQLPPKERKQHRPFWKNIKGKKSYRDRYT